MSLLLFYIFIRVLTTTTTTTDTSAFLEGIDIRKHHAEWIQRSDMSEKYYFKPREQH